tara:strand:- start:735 stop:995 length:261 start_codon:yes stop_codon:yes gene_type:complete
MKSLIKSPLRKEPNSGTKSKNMIYQLDKKRVSIPDGSTSIDISKSLAGSPTYPRLNKNMKKAFSSKIRISESDETMKEGDKSKNLR